MNSEQEKNDFVGRLSSIGSVGTEMVAPIAIGWLLDYWLGTMPWIMIACAVLGFVGGIYHLILLNRPRDSK